MLMLFYEQLIHRQHTLHWVRLIGTGKDLGDIKTKCELCSRCSENCTGDCMWKDLFESLQTIPLRRAMIQRMTRMTAELPPEIGHEISLHFDGDY
jgi:L-lactate utilization protein LutB